MSQTEGSCEDSLFRLCPSCLSINIQHTRHSSMFLPEILKSYCFDTPNSHWGLETF